MKKILCAVLALLLLCGCGASAPTEMTVDESFVIVCAEDPILRQAAISLQSNLKHTYGLELALVTAAEGKSITISVDSALEDGQYRTRLTKNIRYADDEGGNMVVQRAPRFNQLVEQYQPDIMCIQEDNRMWAPILEKFCADRYGFHGMYSGGPVANNGQGGNKQLIFYRSDRYEQLESSGFWLSDTPEEASKLEGSKSIRSCTWVLLKDKLTGQTLFVCNTHLDTISEEVRLAQLHILYQQVGSYMEKYPTVFCGDFNARPDGGVYAEVTKTLLDPHETAAVKADDYQFTYTAYDTTDDPRRLDYLFYNQFLTAQSYRILTDQYDGYVSDHYGVITEYSFAK